MALPPLVLRSVKGSNLDADECDGNNLRHEQRIDDIIANPPEPIEISNVTAAGTQLTVWKADGSSYTVTIPLAAFRPSVGAEVTGATHSVVGGNANSFLYLSNAGGCAVTFDDDDALAVDQEVTFYCDTDGPVMFDSSTDISLVVPPGFLKQIKGLGFTVAFKKRAAGVYVGIGTFAEDVTA